MIALPCTLDAVVIAPLCGLAALVIALQCALDPIVIALQSAHDAVVIHQQNVKTTPGPPRGVMVPLVLLVHLDLLWFTFSIKFEKVWIRMDRSGPGGPRGPQPPWVDQEHSGPPWTTLRHFPDVAILYAHDAVVIVHLSALGAVEIAISYSGRRRDGYLYLFSTPSRWIQHFSHVLRTLSPLRASYLQRFKSVLIFYLI